MTLTDWQKSGALKAHKPSAQELKKLLALADRYLADSRIAGLSTDGRLHAAYSAALTLATVALHASGYRTNSNVPGHHAVTVESLAFSLVLDSKVVRRLDAFRKKRNRTAYEIAGAVSEQEVSELRALATKLRTDVEAWLRKNHPGLI